MWKKIFLQIKNPKQNTKIFIFVSLEINIYVLYLIVFLIDFAS